ncbi:MAG: hypothetical protein AB1465_06235 [Patescibacteria group bacterium]
MKYIARFVFYHYDEFDTTLANIYDILIEADQPSEALKIGRKIVSEQTEIYSSPGNTDFVSLTDENGVISVLSNGQLVILPKEDYDKLPRSFCNTGETFFIVEQDKIPKMRF